MDFHIVDKLPVEKADQGFVNVCAVCRECTHTESVCHMYKTKLCWFVNRQGGCRNRGKCIFAHTKSEIRQAPAEAEKFYVKPPREKHLRKMVRSSSSSSSPKSKFDGESI